MPNYEVIHEEGVGIYRKGDIVPDTMIAGDEQGIKYLLRVGAIKTSKKDSIIYSQGHEAMSDLLRARDLRITELETQHNQTVKSYVDQLDHWQKTARELQKQLDDLKKDITAREEHKVKLVNRIAELEGRITELTKAAKAEPAK